MTPAGSSTQATSLAASHIQTDKWGCRHTSALRGSKTDGVSLLGPAACARKHQRVTRERDKCRYMR